MPNKKTKQMENKSKKPEWERELRDLWFRGGGQSAHFLNSLIPFVNNLRKESYTAGLRRALEAVGEDTLSKEEIGKLMLANHLGSLDKFAIRIGSVKAKQEIRKRIKKLIK